MNRLSSPSGRVVNVNYATGGGCCNSRVASVVDQTTSATVANNLSYNAAGETTSRTLGNGVVENFSYNARLQLTGITATLTSNTLMNFAYGYGTTQNTGRLLSRTDAVQPEHSAEYFYDSIYRLSQSVGVHDDWSIHWTFDTWGNRLTQTPQGLATSKVGTQTSTYANNRLTAITNLTYDNAGNLTNEGTGGHFYAYNAESQITQMDGGSAVYGYDGEGRRMKKIVGNETTFYFYGPGGIVSEFTTTTGVTTASSTDRSTYRTSDKLGSAVLLLDSNGTVIENNRTLPYGELWLSDATPTINKTKFTSYERDAESNLDYAMNRYLSNNNGRFMSPDKGNPQQFNPSGLNRYIYVAADPVNATDATGNEREGPEAPYPAPPGCYWMNNNSELKCSRGHEFGGYDPDPLEEEYEQRQRNNPFEAIMNNIKVGRRNPNLTDTQKNALIGAVAGALASGMNYEECWKHFGKEKHNFTDLMQKLNFEVAFDGDPVRDEIGIPAYEQGRLGPDFAYRPTLTNHVLINDNPVGHPGFFGINMGARVGTILHEVLHAAIGGSDRTHTGADYNGMLKDCKAGNPLDRSSWRQDE